MGAAPWTRCRNSTSRKTTPTKVKSALAATTSVADSGTEAIIRTSSIGTGARRSTRTSAVRATTAITSVVTTTGSPYPSRPPTAMPYTSVPRPTMDRNWPGRSRARSGTFVSLTAYRVTATVTTASGAFTRYTAYQSNRSSSAPPSSGPTARPTPDMETQMVM